MPSGIVEPIRLNLKDDFMGVGKKEQGEEVAESATKRRALETEKEETEEQKKRKLVCGCGGRCSALFLWTDRVSTKQDHHLEKEKIKEDVTEMNKVFYCDVCNKQYTQALQYDQHLSSYDHHHKKVRADGQRRHEVKSCPKYL